MLHVFEVKNDPATGKVTHLDLGTIREVAEQYGLVCSSEQVENAVRHMFAAKSNKLVWYEISEPCDICKKVPGAERVLGVVSLGAKCDICNDQFVEHSLTW